MWGSLRLAPVNRSVTVCYHKICCIPHFTSKTSFIGSLWCFQGFYCLAFAENASFKSFGVICWSPPPSALPGELSMYKQDSDGFFSTRIVCMASGRSSNTTGSSLIIAHWQISLLAICACYKLLTQHSMPPGTSTLAHVILLDIMQWHACMQCAFLWCIPRSVYVLLYYNACAWILESNLH